MRFFLLLLLFVSGSVFCQPFQGIKLPLLQHIPFFSSEYVLQNNVKAIHTEILYKSESEVIKDSKESQIFNFARSGKLSSYVQVNRYGDTARYNYGYNENGLLHTEELMKQGKKESTIYSYDSKNRILQKTSTGDFEIRNGVKHYKYEDFSETQYKKYFLNSEGLTYKYTLVNHDNFVMQSTQTRFVRGTNRSYDYYKYKDGRLVELSINKKESTRRETKYILKYDALKRLEVVDTYVDGALIFHTELLYSGSLVTVVLEKEIRTKRIKICKLKYTYN